MNDAVSGRASQGNLSATMRCPDWLDRWTLAGRCAVLMATIGGVASITAIVATTVYGANSVVPVGLAAIVCVIPSAAALLMVGCARGPAGSGNRLNAMLLGMLVETSVPLAFGVAVVQWAPQLHTTLLFGSLIAFYLGSLFLKTALLLPLVAKGNATPTSQRATAGR